MGITVVAVVAVVVVGLPSLQQSFLPMLILLNWELRLIRKLNLQSHHFAVAVVVVDQAVRHQKHSGWHSAADLVD